MAERPSSEKPVWLITGCSTGFGRELAKILLARGYRAVVTARDKAKVTDLVEGHSATALAVALDVEKQPEIEGAVEAARQKFGRIDVLVNNAGYGYLAAIEEGDDADIRAMFDANVFGLAAMTRAVLPVMRAQKSGAIVNISSVGGFIGFPGSGYYAATKFAVEGLSESLSKEVGPLGIKVVIVEPGPFRTDWAGRSLKTPKRPVDAYADTAIARRSQIQSISGSQPGDPVRAAEAIIAAVEQPSPPLRLPLGNFAYEFDARRDRGVAQGGRGGRGGRAQRGLSEGGVRRAQMTADPFGLQRFVEAQAPVYGRACAELRAGRKESHWMWFIFPQIARLGLSPTSVFYAISSIDEAKAYLAHPVLGPRLRECAKIALDAEGRTAGEIFGVVDEMKFRSSMTLFARASAEANVFERCLAKYFGGARTRRRWQNSSGSAFAVSRRGPLRRTPRRYARRARPSPADGPPAP